MDTKRQQQEYITKAMAITNNSIACILKELYKSKYEPPNIYNIYTIKIKSQRWLN